MVDETDNVVQASFNTRYRIEQDMKERLEQVIYGEFGGKVSAVATIGVLHLLIADVIAECAG